MFLESENDEEYDKRNFGSFYKKIILITIFRFLMTKVIN